MADSAPPPAESGGYHDVDALPLGKLLRIDQRGRTRSRKGLISKLRKKGFSSATQEGKIRRDSKQ